MGRQRQQITKEGKLSMRITQADKIFYTNLSKKLGYKSLSDFILQRLKNIPIINYEVERYRWDAVRELSKEINAIGNNINQIAKEFNLLKAGHSLSEEVIKKLSFELEFYEVKRAELLNVFSKTFL